MTSYRSFELGFQNGDPCRKSLGLFDATFKGTLKVEKIPIEPAVLGEISEEPCVVWREGNGCRWHAGFCGTRN